MDPIDSGDLVRLTMTFIDPVSGAPADPDAVALILTDPSGAQTAFVYPGDITKVATGEYERLFLYDAPGTWRGAWAGTGAAGQVQDFEAFVRPAPSDPAVFAGVTAAEVKARSRVDFAALDVPFDDPDLDDLVAQATASVSEITGRSIDASLPGQVTASGLPGTNLVALARQAVRMRSEQLAFQAQPDSVETSSDEAIETFSAGGYSETRRGPVRLTRGGAEGGLPAVTGWPALDHVLYLLMTPDARDYWRFAFGGQAPPADGVTEVDWGNVGGRLGGSGPWSGWAAGNPFVWGA